MRALRIVMPMFLVAVSLYILSVPVLAQGCKFDSNGFRKVPTSSTSVVIDAGRVRKIMGIVNPENYSWELRMIVVLYRKVKNRPVYIGSQVVDRNGWFCFGALPSGQYVMKLGGVIVWETADVLIQVDSRLPVTTRPEVIIRLGMAI